MKRRDLFKGLLGLFAAPPIVATKSVEAVAADQAAKSFAAKYPDEVKPEGGMAYPEECDVRASVVYGQGTYGASLD